jgi:hypothetical protein
MTRMEADLSAPIRAICGEWIVPERSRFFSATSAASCKRAWDFAGNETGATEAQRTALKF